MADIKRYGSSEGWGYYWVKTHSKWDSLRLVAISDLGEVVETGGAAPHDAAALTRAEAVLVHLAPGVKQADADLERRRAEMPEEPEEQPPPMDPATARFYEDLD